MSCEGCGRPEKCTREICCGICPDNEKCPYDNPCPTCKPQDEEDAY